MTSPDAPSPLVVAIDGPSGSGKSTVSRAVARRYGIAYLDTGAMYRALTWWCRERGIELADTTAVAAAAHALPLEMGTDPAAPSVSVEGTRVDDAIRKTAISASVSAVATNLAVRGELARRQRELIHRARVGSGGVVVEGRDITTVVAPDADVRILLVADERARLARRAAEVHGSADSQALAATADQVLRRDRDDATVARFQRAADGVVTVDTSVLDLDQSIQVVLRVVAERTGRAAALGSS